MIDLSLPIANRLQSLTDASFHEAAARLREESGFLGTGTDAKLLANALRWRRFYRPTSFYGHRLGAGVSIISSYRGLLDIFTTDSWGVCKNTIGGENGEARIRHARRSRIPVVAFFGGSTMQGIGSRLPEFTIPAQVEASLLERYGVNTVCLNHGVAGWTCAEEFLFLLHETTYRPDVCIFYDGWNCCWHFYHAALLAANAIQRTSRQPLATWERGTSLVQYDHAASTDLAYSIAFLAKRFVSLLVNRLFAWADKFSRAGVGGIADKVVELMFPVPPVSAPRRKAPDALSESEADQFAQAAVAEYVRLDSCARRICEARGIRFLHFFQPLLLNTRKTLTPTELRLRSRESMERESEIFGRFRSHLGNENGTVPIIDLSGALDDVREEVFVDGGHLNHYGNYHAALCIARHLIDGNHLRAV